MPSALEAGGWGGQAILEDSVTDPLNAWMCDCINEVLLHFDFELKTSFNFVCQNIFLVSLKANSEVQMQWWLGAISGHLSSTRLGFYLL